MQKKIGNVILDYTYYKGQDLYSDGIIEDNILDIVKTGKEKDILYSSNEWPILYHLSDIRENILEWYPFCENAKTLEIGSGCGALTGLLSRKSKDVTCIELSEKRSLINAYRNQDCENITIMLGNFQDIIIKDKYDYITLIGVWEYAGLYVNDENPYLRMLEIVKKFLKKDGKIIIAIENKMGLKYWNGALEDHTSNLYSSLNDYVDDKHVRTFSKPEIEKIFKQLDINNYAFYYPVPDYKLPDVVYSDEILPKPGAERNYRKDYNACRMYNFYDATASDQICQDSMYPYFSNSFLIITGEKNTKNYFQKYNRCRKENLRIKTEIYEENERIFIRKKALNEPSKKHIIQLKNNEKIWIGCLPALKYIEGKLEDDEYITQYIEGIDLDTLFYEYRNDADLFVQKYCYFIDTYLRPLNEDLVPFSMSDQFISIFGNNAPLNEVSLKITNIDLIFSNLRLTKDSQLYCFDYEWIYDFSIPYDYVLWRNATQLYSKYMVYLRSKLSLGEFLKSVGIHLDNIPIYNEMERNFANSVFGINDKENYLQNYRKIAINQTIKFS
ncbi:class I SAM-dependent methyltransferase [[Clostridium] fimetarium]|uniref:Methyltransferase domain-containing protein n=1 Tax=[Clostridium] fimetarium TaxID=99656 RepID=A0A1I0P4G8_9FIRM|nr:class I SAM-dependent methyltransferase [[Clostridium] fimetarium]SEW09160.1 Methyltransferase domain-containing protein [[Clostridium] fimetarium]